MRVGLVAVAADRRLDAPAPRARPAAHERHVAPLERAPADEVPEPAVGLLGARDDEQAGGVAVEPVDDPGPLRHVAARDARRGARGRASRSRGPARDERRSRPACPRRAGARPRTRSERHVLGLELARVGVRRLEARAPPRPRAGGSSACARRRRARARSASSRSAAARDPTSGSAARNRSSRSPGRLRQGRRASEPSGAPVRGLRFGRDEASSEQDRRPRRR